MTNNRRTFLKSVSSVAVLSAFGSALRLPAPMAALASGGAPHDLCFASARELVRLLRSGKLSAREVMAAHLSQINLVNPSLNAIVATLDDEACLELADRADQRAARGETLGPLHGLPIAFKDLEAAVAWLKEKQIPIYGEPKPRPDGYMQVFVTDPDGHVVELCSPPK